MNNFFKKIGVGAMSLSLVLGVAASNGLVANANSNVKGKSINVSNVSEDSLAKVRQALLNIKIGSKLNELGNWGNVALAKEIFNFKIFGPYSLSLAKNGDMSEYNKILDDVNDLNEIKKNKRIENIKDIENNIKSFNNGKHLLEYIFSNGMKEGIHNVKIGNDSFILFFEKGVQAKNIKNINESINDIKSIIDKKENHFKSISIKDIEGKDHVNVFIGENNDNQPKK